MLAFHQDDGRDWILHFESQDRKKTPPSILTEAILALV
jgi:hypothetical protein